MDYLIKNAYIIDGSGSKGCIGNVLLSGGRIARITAQSPDCISHDGTDLKVIDAAGKCLTPGFIDIHRHADLRVFMPEFGELELRQGLTTIINGNCGLSVIPCPAPVRKELFDFLSPVTGRYMNDVQFSDFKSYMSALPAHLPLNVGMLVGNCTVRTAVCGYRSTAPDETEYRAIHEALEEALSNGAFGVSIGLQYAPECHYDMTGLIRSLEPIRGYDIPLCTHTRGDGIILFDALKEVLSVAEALSCRLQISHFKNMGKRFFGKRVSSGLAMLDRARENGLTVNTDVYPYSYGSTQLIHIMPPSYLEGGISGLIMRLKDSSFRSELTRILESGDESFENMYSLLGWESFYLTGFATEANQKYTGMSVPQIAALRGTDCFNTVYDLLIEEQGRISMIDYITCEDDIAEILRYPYSCIISDSTYPTGGLFHPRVYGTFPRIISEYAGKRQIINLETAVYKMTGLPASIMQLKSKGLLREGYDADLCLFDSHAIRDNADISHPDAFSSGLEYVFVGGEPALIKDTLTGICNGHPLRR